MEELIEYSENHTTPEPEALAKLNRETHLTQVYPQMLSGHLQGTFLRMVCLMIKPQRVLEIGTFTGYSAIAMALGMTPRPDFSQKGRGEKVMHTIEVNQEFEEGIRRYFKEAGLEDQIVLHIGEALEIIPTLDEVWDLVFIDADKPNYLNYYNMIFSHVRPGGFIIADNVLWDGKVAGDPATMDKDTRAIVEFNEFVQQDERVENLLLPIRDGLMLIRKID
ncbi:MAG: O-methyltransferase [Bacteroidetes bacterium]|nr:O-methyltransferase [Bacteroidota bacterium]